MAGGKLIRWVLAAALAAAGCKTATAPGQVDDVAAAVAGTVLGATAAAVNRAQGGCYATCTNGTSCNEVTGMCEPLPCRGTCATNEICDEKEQRCVRAVESTLSTKRVQDPLAPMPRPDRLWWQSTDPNAPPP